MSSLLKNHDVLVVGSSTVTGCVIPRSSDSGAGVTMCKGREVITATRVWVADGHITLTHAGFTEVMSWGKALAVYCDEALLHKAILEEHRRGILAGNETGSSSLSIPMALTGRRASRAGDLAGQIALAGGGSGGPGLITVEGRRMLRLVGAVVTDHLGLLSLLGDLEPDVEIIDASKPPYGRAMAQERINELLVHHTRGGYFVVRLKDGDPYILGHGFEEPQELQRAGIPVRVMPGITSALAVPGTIDTPVIMRGINHELTVVSGHVPPGHKTSLVNWDTLNRIHDTIAITMGVKSGPKIAETLVKAGHSPRTPAAATQGGTLPNQRSLHCTLDKLGERMVKEVVKPPAIIVIDKVVNLGEGDR